MWTTAYSYPTPATNTAPITPALILSVSESTRSDVEITYKPGSKSKKESTSNGQSDEGVVTIKRHHHHKSRRQYFLPGDSSQGQPTFFQPHLSSVASSSASPLPSPALEAPSGTRGAHFTLPSLGRRSPRLHKAPSNIPMPMPKPVQIPNTTAAGPSKYTVHNRVPTRGKRKRALCIGINYTGQQWWLRGCINDAKRVRRFLIECHGFLRDDIILLTDSDNSSGSPTRKNILQAMRWLVSDAQSGDSLFFHFSGHGGQTPDLDGDETDGQDEVIFPLDYQRKGIIVDDDMHAIMVKNLPDGCRLTALFDSCHSGTALDLPFVYLPNGHLKGGKLTKAGAAKQVGADVVSWSSCEDGQTSKDTFSLDGSAVGAMSNAFVNVLKQDPRLPYKTLLKHLRAQLEPRYNQKPQLSSSHKINTNDIFVI